MLRGKLIWVLALVLLLPAATVAWLATRLLEQDRALEAQRSAERCEQAAARAVQTLTLLLADPALLETPPPAGALLVSLPAGPLLYRNEIQSSPEARPEIYLKGEQLEFQGADPAPAIAWYRELAQSSEGHVRAGALLRLGRALKKAERRGEALRAYEYLALLEDSFAGGWPAPVAALWSRCQLLEGAARRQEAQRLWQLLRRGDLRLTRDAYAAFADDAARWTGQPRPAELERLTDAVLLVEAEVNSGARPGAGRAVVRIGDAPVTVVWSRNRDALHALAASAGYVSTVWLKHSGPGIWLRDEGGAVIGDVQPGKAVAKYTAETRLPWTLLAVEPPVDDGMVVRRRMLVILLGAVGLFTLLGGLLVGNAFRRELALARMQENFVAAVSHEFRTPLTSMRQITEALEDGRVVGEGRLRASYGSLARATQRLHRLVEDLLDFRRMEPGGMEYRKERIEVKEFTESLLAGFRQEAAAGGFEVMWSEIPAAFVRGDREALGRALWNLLDNAVKYSGAARRVEAGVEVDGETVRWFVRDHGAGIPASEQKLIFRRFYRGQDARRAGIRGTGIGLAMVAHIVESHRGRVSVSSPAGGGSLFTISVPLEAEPCHAS